MRLRYQNLMCALLCTVAIPAIAKAEKSECASAYERAQELRADSRLRDARRALQTCVQPECPEFVRSECGRWLSEVETSLPSIVLVAKQGETETEVVKVMYDDELLAENLDGKALAVDPGQHILKFVTPGKEPITVKVVIREGEKNRQVVVELGERRIPAAKPTPPQPVAVRPPSSNWTGYTLTGLGVLGVSGFAILGIVGNREYGERQRTCAPNCSESEVSSIRTKYHLADLSLGVGVVSLGIGGYLLLTSPREKPTSERGVGFDVHLVHGGGFATMGSKF